MTGFEPLIGAAAAGLGSLITNLVKDKGTETLKKLDWDIGKNLALKQVEKLIEEHYDDFRSAWKRYFSDRG